MNRNVLYKNYIQEIYASLSTEETLNSIEIQSEIDLLKSMFLNSESIQCLNVHQVFDETKTKCENYIGEYKIKNLMFVLIIPSQVNLLKNAFEPSLMKIVLRQNRITFYDNEIKFFMGYFPKYIYEQLLANNETYKQEIEPHQYDEEIKKIMIQTSYTYEESFEKFMKMNKNIENVILDYLGESSSRQKSSGDKSMNQNIYSEIRNFMNKNY